MRKFKIILSWIMVSLIFQCGVLFFLDKFYFKDNTNVEMKQVQIKKEQSLNGIEVNIPKEAQDIKVSYNGKYISYYYNKGIYICDTHNGESKKLTTDEDRIILRSTWLQDRNILLTLEVEDGQIVLYNYDVSKGNNQKIVDICSYNTAYKNFEIKASTITGVTYIKINNLVYRIDINQSGATRVPLYVNKVGDISIMPTKDRLVYIGINGTVLHLTQPNERISVSSKYPLKILGIDESGFIYLGEIKENKVCKIIRKNLEDPNEKNKIILLDEGVNPKNILITGTGEIYINYSSKEMVKKVSNGEEIKYKGKFISFYNNGVSTIVDNKYYKTEFNK